MIRRAGTMQPAMVMTRAAVTARGIDSGRIATGEPNTEIVSDIQRRRKSWCFDNLFMILLSQYKAPR